MRRARRRFSVVALVASAALAASSADARLPACALALVLAGWWWGSLRLDAFETQRPRAGDRPLRVHHGDRDRASPQLYLRAAAPGGGASFRRALAPGTGAAGAAARPLAAAGSRPRAASDGGRAARPRRRLRRARLARAPRRPRRPPRARLADRRPSRRYRRPLRSAPGACRARDRSRTRGRAARRAGWDRARRGRGAERRAPRRFQGLGALPPAGRVGPEHHLPGAGRARAGVAARDPAARGGGGRDRGDRRLRPCGRLAAVRRARRRGGRARIACLAALPAARPLALPRARRRRLAGVDADEPARARVPAFVRSRRLDLPRRPPASCGARGLPAHELVTRGSCRLDGVRRRDGADSLAPVRQRSRLLAAGERARHARDRAAARDRPRRLPDCAGAAQRRLRARLAERLARRLHRRLRAADRRAAVRAGRLRHGRPAVARDAGGAAPSPAPAALAAAVGDRERRGGAPGSRRLAAAAGRTAPAAHGPADHLPRRRARRCHPAPGARGRRPRRPGAAGGGRRGSAPRARCAAARRSRPHAPAARPHRRRGGRSPAVGRGSRPRSAARGLGPVRARRPVGGVDPRRAGCRDARRRRLLPGTPPDPRPLAGRAGNRERRSEPAPDRPARDLRRGGRAADRRCGIRRDRATAVAGMSRC